MVKRWKVIVRMASEFMFTIGLLIVGPIKFVTSIIRYVARGVHTVSKWIDSHPDKVIDYLSRLDDKVGEWALTEVSKESIDFQYPLPETTVKIPYVKVGDNIILINDGSDGRIPKASFPTRDYSSSLYSVHKNWSQILNSGLNQAIDSGINNDISQSGNSNS